MVYSVSIQELFKNRSDQDLTLRCYLIDPRKKTEAKDLLYWDQYAARDIEAAENLIQTLREYRQAIADRCAQLATMPYNIRLELIRQASWYGKGVTYHIAITKTFEDGTSVDELREHCPGKERHKALARFEELKKQRPGIETYKDIEKSKWER